MMSQALARTREDYASAMRLALDLAAGGLGSCGSNPCVGAVVLDSAGEVVGAGRTEPHGARPGRHAEVVALAQAGARAVGGTVVSTLEPCNGTGRTGPCAQAVAAAGVVRAVYAVADPIPKYAGGGRYLAARGVEVVAGLLEAEGFELHRPWATASVRGTPWTTLKLASSLDGRAAAADGSSQWITSPDARADAHHLRARVDAIVVGSGTVVADDPRLTVRGVPEPRTPLRVVLDRRGRIPASARVLDSAAPALRYGGDLDALARTLFDEHDVRHLLVEGGPTVAGAYLAAGLVDEVVAYLAPAVLGAGSAAVVTAAFPTIADARRFTLHDVRRIGPDLRLTLHPAVRGPAEHARRPSVGG